MSSPEQDEEIHSQRKNHLVFCFWAVVHRMSQNTSKSSMGSSEFITGLHTSSPAPFLPCSPCLSPLSLHLCSVLYICPLPPLWLSLSVPAPGHSSPGFASDSPLKWEPGLRPPDFPQTGSGCPGCSHIGRLPSKRGTFTGKVSYKRETWAAPWAVSC